MKPMITKLLLIAFSLGCFFVTKENAQAENSLPSSLQEYMEKAGEYYGESGDCMYTYTENKKEIKIIGFNEKAKNIRIPSKIEGKNVRYLQKTNISGKRMACCFLKAEGR